MKLKDMQLEELELLSHADITYLILQETKKSMPTIELFKKICELLDYSESEFESKIGDYYMSLTTDKRFTMLKNNEWDLRDNHSVEIVMDEDEDEDDEQIFEEDEDEEIFEEEDEETIIDDDETLDDDIDDDIDDLTIIDDEDIDDAE